MMNPIPEVKMHNGRRVLFVDGKPFHARGGELHNSSSSTAVYMEQVVWPALRPLHMNTVVLPVAWEMIEEKQGVFDFSLVDELLAQARREGMRYVLLWFGLWKNGRSTYVPGWVKRDYERYWLVRDRFGNPIRTVSPLCEEAVQADANAFAHLMAHLKEVDEARTVIAMQIENEMGILGSERDFSARAEELYAAELPAEVAALYGKSGTWEQAFGYDAPEQFSVWCYAKAIETIAAAGKAEYALPMYVNAWLQQHPDRPGLYPAGGPIAKCYREWTAYAPSLDFLAPDIYVSHFRATVDEYASGGNPLFIPEVRGSMDAIPFYLYAAAQHDAICFAPFGIEDLYTGADGLEASILEALNIETAAFKKDPRTWKALASAYRQVEAMQELIDWAREEGKLHAFLEEDDLGQMLHLKDYDIRLNYHANAGYGGTRRLSADDPRAGGFVIELSDSEFLVVGVDVNADFMTKLGSYRTAGYERIEEGCWENGAWKCYRVRNGDEGGRVNFGAFPAQVKVTMFQYQ